MSVKLRIEDSIILKNAGHLEGALLMLLVGVSAAARKKSEKTESDRVRFERFLDSSSAGRIRVEFRGVAHSLSHIFYKWLRCELVHEGGVPVDIEFIDRSDCFVRAGGAPSYVLQLSTGWLDELEKLLRATNIISVDR